MPDPSLVLLRQDRSFRAFWLGQAVSVVGSEISAFALPLVSALSLGAGPRGVSIVATAAMLPSLLFSLLAGHWLAGRDERRVMIPANLIQAGLLALIPLAWFQGWLTIPVLAAITFLTGTAGVVFGLSSFAYVPKLVAPGELTAANRAVQGTQTAAQLSGPGLAGLLVQVAGPPLALLVDAASYVGSAIGVASGHPRSAIPDVASLVDPRSVGVFAGMRLLVTNRYLAALAIHAGLFNLAYEIITINLVLWAVVSQGVSSGTFGLAVSLGGIGGLVGTVTAHRFASRVGFGPAFVASLMLSCGAPLLLAVWPLHGERLAALIGAIMLVGGIGLGNANVYSLTLRQTAIPPEHLARSAGAYRQVTYGAIPLGSVCAGLLGGAFGTRSGVALGAVVLTLSMLPMAVSGMRRLQTVEDARYGDGYGDDASLTTMVAETDTP
jgi:MFS family permease